LQQAVGSMTYMLRDIVHLLDVCPDKAKARAAHQAELNGGDEFAFRLLKPLRGRLIEVRGGDAARWCVASLDGRRLAVVCFNDGREDAAFPLQVAAPPGTRLAAGRVLGVRPRGDGQGLELTDEALPPGGTHHITVPATGARTLVFDLDAAPAALPVTAVEQHFAHGVLATVPPGASLTRIVRLPPASLAGATRARLKLVVADQDADCRLTVNGRAVPLPPAGTWTTRIGLDPAVLTAETRLEFSASSRPLRVLMASIELVAER
jgi:hypothetical protein